MYIFTAPIINIKKPGIRPQFAIACGRAKKPGPSAVFITVKIATL